MGGYFVDGFKCHLASAAVAGVTATLVASPVDVVKTRYMNAERGRYRGALHCANVTFKTEGAKAFYKGFNASCLRLVSWNICLWLSYEQLKSLSRAYYANKPNLKMYVIPKRCDHICLLCNSRSRSRYSLA